MDQPGDYIEPQNYSAAKKLAREVFGYQIVHDYDWGVIKVYKTGISKEDLKDGVGVYETIGGLDDWQDAWGTMKSMWRADNAVAKNSKASN